MTPGQTLLQAHDLKMAKGRSDDRQERINILLKLITKHCPYSTVREIVGEYRTLAKGLS